jgi:hypothetical protein
MRFFAALEVLFLPFDIAADARLLIGRDRSAAQQRIARGA